MPSSARWQSMHPRDLPAVTDLSLIALGEAFAESQAVYANRLALCPHGSMSCIENDRLVGYSVAHPWLRAHPPALNQQLGALPATPDCWYLHDTAIDASAQGQGLAARMLGQQELQARAHGFSIMALVAVGSAASYWQRHGFISAMTPSLRTMLASYGEDAAYMEKTLPVASGE